MRRVIAPDHHAARIDPVRAKHTGAKHALPLRNQTGKSYHVRFALLKVLLLSVGLSLVSGCAASGVPGAVPATSTAIPATPTPTPTPVPGVLYVDAGSSLGPISPLVYGTNTGPWQNLGPTRMAMIRENRFTLLRFPGGNWGDENSVWEGQIDPFIALCREIGAEPVFHVKLFQGTPETAAKWVRYANVEKGYGIRYWAIGNEPDLYEDNRGAEGYGVEQFNAEWRAFAEAMKAVDPSIRLMGPETSQYTPRTWDNPHDTAGKDWLVDFLRANGDLVDIASIHRYPFGLTDPSPQELLRSTSEWDAIIPLLRQQIREATGRDLPIAVTEVNSNWSNRQGNPATPDTYLNALWWADVLGRLIAQRVDLVAHFALADAGGLGMLDVQAPRPTYYVFSLYREFGSELVYGSSDEPGVSIYASRREDGALAVMLVNLGAEEVTKPLRIEGFTPSGSAEVWLLDAAHNAEPTGTLEIGGETEVTLPPQSATLLVIP